MAKRKKRLEKQEKSLLKQAEEHKRKQKELVGGKDTTRSYWEREEEMFRAQAEKRRKLRNKLTKK